ncbi:MAG: YgdI/YgdR family lipoprotein [Chloroflexi bacterium]|nr:YgdI/YgdR family lipoprotein [Chloroflexota bacterium]
MSAKRLTILIVLTTAVFLLAGCGSGEATPTVPAAVTEPTGEAPPHFHPRTVTPPR